jgi:NADPH-dependent curcumin reductase CurA
VRTPHGPPTDDDFDTRSVPLPEVTDGGVAVATTIISVDPYMRPGMNAWAPPAEGEQPKAFGGGSVGMVTESKADGFAVGDLVIGRWGWSDRAVCKAEEVRKLGPHALAVPSTALNLYGANGLTAYMGVEQILQPKEGETVYVLKRHHAPCLSTATWL